MLQVDHCYRYLRARSREYDKRQHFFYSLALVLAAAFLAPFWLAVVSVFVIGLGKECWDHFWGSGFCWIDMVANALGIVAGALVWWLCGFLITGVFMGTL